MRPTASEGGSDPAFRRPIVSAVTTLAACVAITVIETRPNRCIGSGFIRLDVRNRLTVAFTGDPEGADRGGPALRPPTRFCVLTLAASRSNAPLRRATSCKVRQRTVTPPGRPMPGSIPGSPTIPSTQCLTPKVPQRSVRGT
jgi:hypothetical protein